MKSKTFSGGYCFKGFEAQPEEKLTILKIPPYVVIPLFQGDGNARKFPVAIGDKVSAGQIIARDDTARSSPVLSSVNGKVEKIEKLNYFNREVTAVTIKSDGSDTYRKIKGYSSQWEKLSNTSIEELLYQSGVTSLDIEGIPTHLKTSFIMPEEVEHIIIHRTDDELYNPSLNILLKGQNSSNFIEGVQILKKIMPQADIHIAINNEKQNIIEQLAKLTQRSTVHPVAPKYPQHYPEVLVKTILNREFPYGYSAAHIGVVVLSIQTILHVFEAVAEGKPLIERVIALCGPSFKENIHIKARIGTPVEFICKNLLKEIPSRIILNSLVAGVEINNLLLPVDKTYSQIIAIPDNKERELFAFIRPGLKKDSYSYSFLSSLYRRNKKCDANLHGEERPCVFCNFCQDVCPVKIIPHLLHHYIEKDLVDEALIPLGIFNCIECNLCSYVCTSKTPLSESLKTGKLKLKDMGCDNPAPQSRARQK